MIIRIEKNIKLGTLLGKVIIEKDGTIIYPTETSYGLGCKVASKKALKKIFQIKKRNKEKKLPVIVADRRMAEKFFKLNSDAKKLISKFMPGPLTLIVRTKKEMPKEIGCNKIAFRISSNEFASELSKTVDYPIVSTSANISGSSNIYSEKGLLAFEHYVNAIFLSGNLKKAKPSTIYDTIEGKILREGSIKKEMIEKALKKKIN
jgi:L-threonylcarbamoyladenylate synthase